MARSRRTLYAPTLIRCIVMIVGAATVVGFARAAERSATFSIRIDDRKADGKSWRGSGDVFANLPGTPFTPTIQMKSAPSPVLCLVRANGDLTCPGSLPARDRTGKPQSPCHLSFDCEFEDIEIPGNELFGVIVIAHGMMFTSLVDAVVLSPKKITNKDLDYQSLNDILHREVERVAPSGSNDEYRRRERAFQLYMFDDCRDAPCRLRQSTMKFAVN